MKEITKTELIGEIIQLYNRVESVQPVVEEKKIYLNEAEEKKLMRLGKETLLENCFNEYRVVSAQRNKEGNIVYAEKEGFVKDFISSYHLPTYFSVDEIRNIFKGEIDEAYLKRCETAKKKPCRKRI